MVEYKLKSKTYLCSNADNVKRKNVQSSSMEYTSRQHKGLENKISMKTKMFGSERY
jgi:hypothetical protein